MGRLDASDSDKNGAVCDTPINDVTEALRTHLEDNYISVTRMQIDAQEWEALKSVHRRDWFEPPQTIPPPGTPTPTTPVGW
jgi:hypothetical protein